MRIFIILFLIFISTPQLNVSAANGQTWCIARSSASEADLQNNIDYVCSNLKHTSCSEVVGEGGFCFNPNTIYNHASILMDVYYVENGRNPWACDFRGTALVAVTDPSYATCIYP